MKLNIANNAYMLLIAEHHFRAINDFIIMVNERADIEKKYAEKLQSWSSKWSSVVKQGKPKLCLEVNFFHKLFINVAMKSTYSTNNCYQLEHQVFLKTCR